MILSRESHITGRVNHTSHVGDAENTSAGEGDSKPSPRCRDSCETQEDWYCPAFLSRKGSRKQGTLPKTGQRERTSPRFCPAPYRSDSLLKFIKHAVALPIFTKEATGFPIKVHQECTRGTSFEKQRTCAACC